MLRLFTLHTTNYIYIYCILSFCLIRNVYIFFNSILLLLLLKSIHLRYPYIIIWNITTTKSLGNYTHHYCRVMVSNVNAIPMIKH